MFRTTTDLTERVSTLQLPYNGLLETFRGIDILKERDLQEEPVTCQDSMVNRYTCHPSDGGSDKANTRVPTLAVLQHHRFDTVPAGFQYSQRKELGGTISVDCNS